jgi:3-methyl-2-oxobutanoate hydroxymethyltransferase
MSSTVPAGASPRITVTAFAALKAAERPIAMLTAYDVSQARIADSAGVDAILVGDSHGMVSLGFDSTLPVTMDQMLIATAAVARGTQHALVIGDMPFMSYQASVEDALRNAGRFLAEGAQAVKLEGSGPRVCETVAAMVDAGIPVMGHLGLTPQSVNAFGGYKVQARDADDAVMLAASALDLQDAGAFAIVLECIPAELAQRVSDLLDIPTIGIGAGAGCDGQVQVYHDLLGLGRDFVPRHAKRFAELGAAAREAVSVYADAVRTGTFPGEEQSTHMDADALAEYDTIIAELEGE